MITELPMEVRLHSWWKTNDDTDRLFVITSIPINWTVSNQVFYPRVELLEYGFDEPNKIDTGIFIEQFKSGRIKPVNVFPRALSER
ncbi:hypothetical protein EOD41_10850 [Mucilaginibacter limnophilus]|uniref:Uncharacterized protein n=1 Tax=Mucilaginibacter limnophilus TaxID=1932778 RepID=A0A437MTW0_9SPHI|nr:hypothetical protein [Mucilaginibacter limnophilus]RVU01104.1 hypothetical protein EOD41_10850 [Mucilaginibacter limnophilus]